MKKQNKITRATGILFLVWTLLFTVLFMLATNHVRQTTKEIALSEARAYFNKDVAFRHWSTAHGGLYVPITRETQPSPYLSHITARDITSSDGTKLTLINPAYATRQLNEMFSELYGIVGHITSLKLLRHENAPDHWEQAALQKFEQEKKEVSEFTHIKGEPYLRLIQPLMVQQGCLKCHSHQDYKVGEVRGGVGISLPMSSLYEKERHTLLMLKISLFSLWIPGSMLLLWGSRKLNTATKERNNVLENLEKLLTERTAHLQEMENFLKKSQEIAHVGSWKLNLQTKVLTWSNEVYRIFGVSRLDFTPNFASFSAAIHPDDREMVMQAYNRAIKEQRPYDIFHRIVRPDGTVRYVHEKSEEIVSDKGETVFSIGMVQDVTTSKQVEMRLQESRNKFQRLVDDMGEKFIVFSYEGLSGKITYVSDGAASISGLEKADIIGRPWQTVIDWLPEDAKSAHFLTQEMITGRMGFAQNDLRFIHPDGGERSLHVSAHPVRDEDGNFYAIDGIAEDITEQRQVELQLLEEQHRAEAANRAKGDFLANMSHEIRTPMNIIIGLTELAMDTDLNPKQSDYLSKIQKSAVSLLAIINDILDFSKIEAGKLRIEQVDFSPTALTGLSAMLSSLAAVRGWS